MTNERENELRELLSKESSRCRSYMQNVFGSSEKLVPAKCSFLGSVYNEIKDYQEFRKTKNDQI